MKNKILYIVAVSIGFLSCKKSELDLVPKTSVSAPTFFKSETEFQQAVVSAYSNLRGVAFTGIYMDEMRSDNTFFNYYSSDRGSETSIEAMAVFLDNSLSSAEPNNAGNRYGNDYSGIAKANTVLTRLKANTIGLSQSSMDDLSGQALFLRAYYYFDLVTHYGGVPLQLEEIVSETGAFLPRNTVDEVYAQIIADLNDAIAKLPVATAFPQTGRVSKGAAKMLLAYAYMSKPTRDYAKAETELLDITKMNYTLLPNYTDVFSPTNKNNSESIFEVQYKAGNDGQQSDFIWRFIPKTTNTEAILGLHGTNQRGGITSGGWNAPTQEMVSSYESGDKRLPASIGVAIGTQTGDSFTISSVVSPVNFTPPAGKTFYYFINKYVFPPYTVEWNTDQNWPVYRYSGALLLLAECLVKQGKNAEALPYLNQVRKRAGLPNLASATDDNVASEMRHELAFENHRWTDLVRNGKAVETLNAKGKQLKSLYGWLLPASFNVTNNRLIYAIPSREVQINSNLVQNPGY
ncbi:RagB/SusD family nutrient uptake outer membrane protein [Pedobacter panaciterrae]|uniref:RagB/SusD family nutrient uptake outer membrane protein n=1 Tax=Pedobacter panaciterrae TaxID=363849 RepID=A0ABU8NUU0_9SPHI|nr:RagB/SusD family nutrient uptake outer membrane protein [Pedobacter panaciterrae]NQX52159.1 RagB/SusD family nutrient uptake outer membrane protein [Pedobacter panaciterrae]